MNTYWAIEAVDQDLRGVVNGIAGPTRSDVVTVAYRCFGPPISEGNDGATAVEWWPVKMESI